MRKLFFLLSILTIQISVSAQDRVGIGTTSPQAQLHTTGDVMFAGIANDNNLTRVLVQSGTGLLGWRDAETLGNYYWSLAGNSGTTSNNFLGTSDQMPLVIKTGNLQRVQINTSAGNSNIIGGVVDITVDSLKANGSGIALYRKANVNRWGTGIEFQMNNSQGQKTFYGRVNGGIESNIAGQENGIIAFEVATNGQLGVFAQQVKMIINSKGFVGIGELFPTAQLHTNGSVLFSGITNNDAYSKILVQDNAGLLFWRNASTVGNNDWSLNGNNNITSNQFIGPINNALLKLRTSNIDRLLIYSANEISTSIDVPTLEILSPSANLGFDGPGLKITRFGSTAGWAAAMDFAMNNNSGGKKTYARLNGGIESSAANNENGFFSFEVAANGQIGNLQQQEKMRITSKGFVGIGTSVPLAQLHTTGSVLFSGITNNNTYNKVLVQDNNGLLYWRDATTIASTNSGWATSGNSVTAGQFIGSTNNELLKLRTSNIDRLLVYSANEISTSIEVPTVEILSPSANLGFDGPGLKITRFGSTAGWAAAMDFAMNNNSGGKKTYARLNGGIESSAANNENGFLSFEVAANGQIGNLQQQEKMRITSKGFVGLGISNPTAQLHTTASVRFQNLANGTGNYLLIDDAGNVYRSAVAPPRMMVSGNSFQLDSMQSAIEKLQLEIIELKNELKKVQH